MQGINLGQNRGVRACVQQRSQPPGAVHIGASWRMLPITSESSWRLWLGSTVLFISQRVSDHFLYNDLIMEIDTVLELEGILELIKAPVFTLQVGSWVQKGIPPPPPAISQNLLITKPGTNCVCTDAEARPLSVVYLLWSAMDTIPQRNKMQILVLGSSRSAVSCLLLQPYFLLFCLLISITFFHQLLLTPATSNFPQFP